MPNSSKYKITEEKIGEMECEIGNVEVQQNNTKKYLLDSVSDFAGKVDKTVDYTISYG